MYTIEELKREAVLAANEHEIAWDRMEDPAIREDFEVLLTKGASMVQDLESIYTKLTSGKSVVTPEQDTPLGYDDLEKYTQLVAEELLAGYILQEIYTRFTLVEGIIQASGSLDNIG